MAPRQFPAPVEEAEIALRRARGGDEPAFEGIIRQHQSMVFSLAYHFLGDAGAAEDLAQDVFFELSRRLERIESALHLTFWLRKVATNRCIDRIRSRKYKEQPVDVLPELAAPEKERDILLEERVRRLVGELPAHARAVMILRYQEDLDPSEISQVLEMPVNTVKSHIRRSVEVIRGRLDGELSPALRSAGKVSA
jgi:RNA polymerase sigma-70 factor, ECF subfamily